MKLGIKNLIAIAFIVAAFTVSSCKKDFFNRPPSDNTTVGSFYQTTDQVQASTNILYTSAWAGFNGKAFLAIGDVQSGNVILDAGADPEISPFRNFSIGNASAGVQNAWYALYTEIAQCNALLTNLPAGVSASVPASAVNNALGEARLMRALSYFYLVRLFGNVPIITDPTTMVDTFQTVPTAPVTDVYKFIVRDLQFAVANCSPNVANTGHVSSGSAAGLLAKVYLYEQNYDSAAYYAEKVINSGEFQLVGTAGSSLSYCNMFESIGNNCSESMIAEQYGGASANAGYGHGNQIQSVAAASNGNGGNPTNITGFTDGWAELGISFDLQKAFIADNDSIRRYGTYMLGGDFYPEITASSGGLTVPYTISAQESHAAYKKYITGTPSDNGGFGAMQSAANNTYLLRYADMYLIAAEAILGKSAGIQPGSGIPLTQPCTDGTALKYLNTIRERAGLSDLSVSNFTYQQIWNERRLEFALEGEFWYDLQRLDGFNAAHHPVAISIIDNQQRGNASAGTAANNYQDYTITDFYVTATDANFLLPIPATEINEDPMLAGQPVPYNFDNN